MKFVRGGNGLSRRKREGVKSDRSLIEIMAELGAKHRGMCPHCGTLYEFDEMERMFGRSWVCKGCHPEPIKDEWGQYISPPTISITDLVDVELFNLPDKLFR